MRSGEPSVATTLCRVHLAQHGGSQLLRPERARTDVLNGAIGVFRRDVLNVDQFVEALEVDVDLICRENDPVCAAQRLGAQRSWSQWASAAACVCSPDAIAFADRSVQIARAGAGVCDPL